MRKRWPNWIVTRGWILLFGILFVTVVPDVWAQENSDSVHVTTIVEKSPRGAMLRSALMPGWGQLYNNQKLKALLVFGGEMALVGNAIYYNQVANKSQTVDEQRFYKDMRSQFLWWLFAIHLLNILDAYVDAHLWNFDTGPDLSLDTIHHGNGGLLLSLRFEF